MVLVCPTTDLKLKMTKQKPIEPANSATTSPGASVELQANQLRRACDASKLNVGKTTKPFAGQARAMSAIELAVEMDQKSYNLFIAAPKDVPVRTLLKPYLLTRVDTDRSIFDYAYVYNFDNPSEPKLLTLPGGSAERVSDSFEELVQDLREAIPAAFEKPEVQARRRALENTFKERQETAFETLGKEAEERNIAILRGPMGFSLAPTQNDEVLQPDDLKALDENHKEERKATLAEFQKRLEDIVRTIPDWERSLRSDLRKLKQETIEGAITRSIDAARKDLCDIESACQHLEAVKTDLIQNGEYIFAITNLSDTDSEAKLDILDSQNPFERYSLNVLVSRATELKSAPVIEETNPTLAHLVGRVEHRSEGGYLTTSFKLIKPGALHHANGGFLILDARNLLSEPMSWRALKRALKSELIKTENLAEALSLTSTITLDPEPVPLSARIILIGDAWIYHVLSTYDPEFSSLFKLFADFDAAVDRTDETENLLASTYSDLAHDHQLSPPSPSALAFLIEDAARENGDACRLSVKTDRTLELLEEAHHYATSEARTKITRCDVERAQEARIHRASRVRDRMQEQLMRGIALVQTEGERVGQINGLSVYQFAGVSFGKPNRITARTRPGNGQIVDIERESRLGGPIHSKGVLVLTGFLSGRYAIDVPFSLHASIVLEQSYGGVEGDSASLAELLAILSAVSGEPIRQSIAITGAVNQLGDAQAIGGVNDKIEGFFDLCKERGFSSGQGVIIPASNVQHLMLRPDVVHACEAGDFAVFAVENVDEAIPLLFKTTHEDLHRRVEDALVRYASTIKGHREPDRNQSMPVEAAPFPLPSEAPEDQPPDSPPETPPSKETPRGSRDA